VPKHIMELIEVKVFKRHGRKKDMA